MIGSLADACRLLARDPLPPISVIRTTPSPFPTVPMPPPKRRRSWGQRLVIAIGATATAICLVAAALLGWGSSQISRIQRFAIELTEGQVDEPLNYLMVGSDARDSVDAGDPDAGAFLGSTVGGRRADTVIVVRVDSNTREVDLLSIPRDLYVPLAGTDRWGRVNAAYAGGPQQLVDTVEAYLDIDINHYVEVDFAGFKGLVDELDGIPIWFDRPMRDRNSGLAVDSGCSVLDGTQALAFARARHLEAYDGSRWVTDGTGDLGRVSRQQLFLRRSVDRATSLGVTDITKIGGIVSVGVEHVSFDEGIDVDELFSVARSFSGFSGNAIRTHRLPVRDVRTEEGAQVLALETSPAQATLNIFRGFEPGQVIPFDVALTVLNGSGQAGQAGVAAEAFEAIGFRVGRVADAAQPVAHTIIAHAPTDATSGDLVARHLSSGAVTVEDPALAPGTVVLTTGADMDKILQTPRAVEATTDTSAAPAPEPTPTSPEATGGVQSEAVEPLPSPPTTRPIGFVPGTPPEGTTCP